MIQINRPFSPTVDILLQNKRAETQLEKGTEVEKEHDPLYSILEKWAKKHELELPFSIDEFREKIARGHIKEIADYYDKLLTFVETSK